MIRLWLTICVDILTANTLLYKPVKRIPFSGNLDIPMQVTSGYKNSSWTLETDDPDFTPCFQQTFLIWVPCGFLFLAAPIYVHTLAHQTKRSIRHSWLNITKTLLGLGLVAICLADFFHWVAAHARDEPVYPSLLVGSGINFLTMVLAIFLIQYGRKKGELSSSILFLFWLFQSMAGILILQSKIRTAIAMDSQDQMIDVFHLVTNSLFVTAVLLELVLSALVETRPRLRIARRRPKPCPEGSASFLSRITFWWYTSVVWKGHRGTIKMENLWDVNPEDKTKRLVPRFLNEWAKEIAKADSYKLSWLNVAFKAKKSGQPKYAALNNLPYDKLNMSPWIAANNHEMDDTMTRPLNPDPEVHVTTETSAYQPSLVMALIRTCAKTFLSGAFFKLLYDIITFVNPQLLSLMIGFTKEEDDFAWKGYLYAVLMFVTSVVHSIVLHQYFHRCLTVGMRLRTVIVSAVYRKSLKLSNSARRSVTVGEITNLMSVDAQRFQDLCTTLNLIWSAPFQMCVALYFLWMTLGPSVLAGLAVMVLLIPINALIAKKSRQFQMSQMVHKDSRLKLINQILSGMKVLKLYAWETSFENKVLGVRDEELSVLKKSSYMNAATSFTFVCAPFLVSLTTFAVYVLSSPDNILDAQKAFVSLSLFNILRFPLSMLPQLIASLVQVSVSVKRLQTFLMNEELDPNIVQKDLAAENPITIFNGTFTWDKADDRKTLENIHLDVDQGSLVAVVGVVGSGKTSLLSAILGEMEKIEGQINVKGEIAYVAQQPWIQNATLKDNILFGKKEDKLLYYKVLKACALERDLDMLQAADMTEIGEKGINVSGGQKQRISLARAVYADSDIYLLDDPLSAVDSNVGKHLFDKVISRKGVLKNKTRILVTHGINFLPEVDQIVVLVDGLVSESGTYKQLLQRNGAFAEFLRNYLVEEEAEIEDLDPDSVTQREEIISTIGDMCEIKTPTGEIEKVTIRKARVLSRQFSRQISQEGPPGSRPTSILVRQTSRPQSDLSESFNLPHCEDFADIVPRKTITSDSYSRQYSRTDDYPEVHRRKPRKLTRQITIADDSCHPPAALMAKVKEKDQLIENEIVETGRVKATVFMAYLRSIDCPLALLIIFCYMCSTGVSVAGSFWLSIWSTDRPLNGTNGTLVVDTQLRDLRLGVYGALGVAQAVFVMGAAISFANGRVRASRNLHAGMLHNIMRSPLHFFDTTPLGRINNRFSRDIDTIDMIIPMTLSFFIQTCLASVSSLTVISVTTPYFMTIFIPLFLLYWFIQRFYVASSRQLKRLESVSRSPIYSHFGETLQGVSTIRAFNQMDRFMQVSDAKVDDNQRAYYPLIVSNRWLGVRLEFVGNIIILATALFAVMQKGSISPGLVGLSISYALTITGTLNMVVRTSSEMETNIIAVERVKDYSETPTEAEWVIEDTRPDPQWPKAGSISFNNYCTRYRPGLGLVLSDISCDIKGGEKVGIVGRTGAGKSSLTLALFRIIEAVGGNISIDGIPIKDIGLHDLRTKLTIIPQDPVLFSGTLRWNLDPFEKFSDDDIWASLEHAHLYKFVSSLPEGLDFECWEGGENLSVGQRQLVCLARALLSKSKVLILDEATAAVDLETDDLIQSTIRTEFEACTVLTIAHRLNTILDYTRILVLDAGYIKEFDSARNLIANKSSIFYSMAKDAGLAE